MKKLLGGLGIIVGVILIIALIYGATELLANLFNVESEGGKRGIRWTMIVLFWAAIALARRETVKNHSDT